MSAELDAAVKRLAALPKPPTCPSCNGTVEAAWWSYCAACGCHLAAVGVDEQKPDYAQELVDQAQALNMGYGQSPK
jgi:hypothetical protein